MGQPSGQRQEQGQRLQQKRRAESGQEKEPEPELVRSVLQRLRRVQQR